MDDLKKVDEFQSLKEVVDRNLAPCTICKKVTLVLVESKIPSFATTLSISCSICKINKNKIQKSIVYVTGKMNKMKIQSKADKETK